MAACLGATVSLRVARSMLGFLIPIGDEFVTSSIARMVKAPTRNFIFGGGEGFGGLSMVCSNIFLYN